MNQQPRIQVFLLNGPPYSGKDTLADAVIANDRTFGKMSMAFPIKEANRAFFGLTEEQFRVFDSEKVWKEKKQDIFMGKSWRQVNIDLAEQYVKKVIGKDAFGHLMVNRIRAVRSPKQGFNVIISDCGFTEEIKPLVDAFGAENVHVIKLQRKGSSYEGDSRNYVDCKKLGIAEYFLRNKGNQQMYVANGFNLVQAIKHGHKPETTPFPTEKPVKKAE